MSEPEIPDTRTLSVKYVNDAPLIKMIIDMELEAIAIAQQYAAKDSYDVNDERRLYGKIGAMEYFTHKLLENK